MVKNTRDEAQFVILCVDSDSHARSYLARTLREFCGEAVSVEDFADAAQAQDRATELEQEQVRVPLLFVHVELSGASGIDLLLAFHKRPRYRATRKVLISAETAGIDLTRALNRGALNANLTQPWTPETLNDITRHLLTEYVIAHAPDALDRLSGLVDVSQLSQAFVSTERRRQAFDDQLKQIQRSFIGDQELKDEEVERNMVAEIDHALSGPARKTIPAGTVLLHEGQQVSGIWILLSGQVSLYRTLGGKDLVFHSQTVGPVIGLMALAHQRNSFFTCRAVTDAEVIPVSLPELEIALKASPMLSVHFVTVLLRSLARRNRRAGELQLEIGDLIETLSTERDQLAGALEQLKRAEMLLVETEKMATLGQLAAGIAHELNNPLAAIIRSTEFILNDTEALSAEHPDGDMLRAVMKNALHEVPLSTRELRARRRQLGEDLGDAGLARTLVELGVYTRAQYTDLLGPLSTEQQAPRLKQVRHAYQLGQSLRNLRSCAERISALVRSLRSYARADQQRVSIADVHVGLDETLLLFGHDLHKVRVERDYGDLPEIHCMPGEINQVWTNLVSNALQAMHGQGALHIQTDAPDPQHVRVRITDNGPGIPPEHIDRIFDVNFTTRQGRADFGLGIGLAICQDIAHRHGGRIGVESEPGRTCFSVLLPLSGPNSPKNDTATTEECT